MDPTNLNSNLGYLITSTAAAMHSLMQSRLTEAGIDIPFEQLRTLAFLCKNPGINQQEMADCLNKTKPGISRLVDQLEKKDLIRREEDGEDRRNKIIFVTDKGVEARDQFIPYAKKELLLIDDKLGGEEAQVLKDSLIKLKSILHEIK
ncbi:MarR family transcriptional regulator [bacterium SCSIO 12741]|nr:MarR family transcriptional regulator [bacterium SCSIO 12741]